MFKNKAPLLIFFLLFTTSGATGLIYESLWTHYLKLFLGHSSYAQTLVLVLFMGGMAVGSWLASRFSLRIANPLIAYAGVEAIIGVIAIVFHAVFTFAVDRAYLDVFPNLESGVLIELLKWLMATALILPPSILLGSTFPLMVTGLLRHYYTNTGKLISLLYFFNSLGAAVGVLASGFWLIGRMGLPGTMLLAGLINTVLALVVYFIARRAPGTETIVAGATTPGSGSPVKLLLMVSLFTGLASFVYEIAWIRMLSLVLGSSTHAFEMMLSAFVFGLALGGLWVRNRISNLAQPLIFLGKIQIVMGLMALLSMLAYDQSFYWMQWTIAALSKTDAGYLAFNIVSHSIALLVMLPTTICAGMTLPVITSQLLNTAQGERAVGRVYAANTCGAIIGIVISVQVLMPLLGLQNLLMVGAVIDVSLGLLLFYNGSSPHLKTAAAATAVLGILIYSQVDFAVEKLTSGVYRDGVLFSRVESLFRQDGKTATVDVYDVGNMRNIATNGKTDASISLSDELSPDEYTMALLAAIPMLLKPESTDVATVGIGSGITSHTILASPYVRRLDTVEIESAMVAGARYFGERSSRVFSDKRSNIVVDDAKTYFVKNNRQYDIIVSEPSNPWVSGVASVFSREFYQLISRYLKQDGFFVQWLHLYESNVDLTFSVLNALGEQFEHYAIYTSVTGDLIIVARNGVPVPELVESSLWHQDAFRRELDRLDIRTIDDLRVRFVANKVHTHLLAALYPEINTDYFPYLDLNATRARFKRENAAVLLDLRTSALPILDVVSGNLLPPRTLSLTETTSGANRLVRAAQEAKRLSEAITNAGAGDRLTAANRNLVFRLNGIRLGCEARIDIKLWEDSILRFARHLPFLSEGELDPVWTRLRSQDCDDVVSHRSLFWIDMLEAVGRRDMAPVLRTANELLSLSDLSAGSRRFLLIAKVMALTATSHHEDALRLVHEEQLIDDKSNIATKLLYLYALQGNRAAADVK